MSKRKDRHLDRPHVADDDAKKVYLTVSSWGGAMAAPHWVAKYYPGYEAVFVTEQYITDRKQ